MSRQILIFIMTMILGADYSVFSKGALITALPTPPDAEGWAYGRFNQAQGWPPPPYVEADEHDSVLLADLASNFGNLDASQSSADSAIFSVHRSVHPTKAQNASRGVQPSRKSEESGAPWDV